jgi:hypothetical protein
MCMCMCVYYNYYISVFITKLLAPTFNTLPVFIRRCEIQTYRHVRQRDYKRGSGLEIAFIDHFNTRLVTALN